MGGYLSTNPTNNQEEEYDEPVEPSFDDHIVKAKADIESLSTQIDNLVKQVAEASELPFELEDEIAEARKTLTFDCKKLEELLLRVQLHLDGISLPTTEDGGVDQDARTQRKSVIQHAEKLINTVTTVRGQIESKL